MVTKTDGRGKSQLLKYGISAEQYATEIAAGNLWCSRGKHFLPQASFTSSQIVKSSHYCKSCYDEYHRQLHLKHKEKRNEKSRQFYAENPERGRRYSREAWAKLSPEEKYRRRLRDRFHLTPAQYNELLAKQNGGCAVCGGKPDSSRLPIDHDHACCPGRESCGRCIRGILCRKCNTLIGMLEKNRQLISRCEAYLESWSAASPSTPTPPSSESLSAKAG